MVNILVRDVPSGIHELLVEQAKERGQSLQQYLRDALGVVALSPGPRRTGREFLEQARIDREAMFERMGPDYVPPTTEEIVAIIRQARGPMPGEEPDGW